jgi:NAD-dependent deacetylase
MIPAELVAILGRAHRVTVLTGSGVSAESGVPTFRDAQTGVWSRFNPQELATPAAFERNPRLVWNWYEWRRSLIAYAKPNAAHTALAEMAKHVERFTLITQNIDGLHQKAGSTGVIELHGNINRTRCYDENVVVTAWELAADNPPRCPRCGGLLRPDVVWFEEALPAAELATAIQASDACDVFMCIGTSAIVHPAASLPLRALAGGATLVVVNPNDTPISAKAHYVLATTAAEAVPALLKCMVERPATV